MTHCNLLTEGMKRSLDDFLESNSCKDALDTNHLAKFILLHPKFVPEELYTSQEKRSVSVSSRCSCKCSPSTTLSYGPCLCCRASNRASSSAAQKELWASVRTKQAATEIDGVLKILVVPTLQLCASQHVPLVQSKDLLLCSMKLCTSAGLLGRFTKLEDQIKDEDITAGSPKAEGPGKAAREDGEEDEQPVDDDEPNEEDFEDDDYLQVAAVAHFLPAYARMR